MRLLLTYVVFLPSLAFAYDSVTFQTPEDKFTVTNNNGKFSVGGKPVQNDVLRTVDPYLTGPIADGCPNVTGRPQITATIVTNHKAEKREFFLQRGVIRTGFKCIFATGDGLFYLPLHRNWLTGSNRESIKLASPLKIQSGTGPILANLTKQNDDWTDTQPKTELDWDFFKKFERSLDDYRVQYRVSPEASKGKPSVIVSSGSQRYFFYKLAPKLWAVRRPNEKWLSASGDWAFWFDLDGSVWQDRHVPLIRKVESGNATKEDKLAMFKELDATGWTRTLQDFYQRHALDNAEDHEVRLVAIERLRSHPSWANMKALMALIQNTDDEELLRDGTLVLKTRNPKGTAYQPGSNARSTVVGEWNEWWEKNKTRKD
jgi:hypothetical protein